MPFVKLPEFKPHYAQAETALIVQETIQGNRMASALFQEAMVRSDMPITFNQITNADLIPQYEAYQPVWKEFSKEITLKDLTEQAYLEVWPDLSNLPPRENGRARVKNKAPRIGANNEYPAIALDESTTKVKAEKYGLRMPLTMEMIINDQLDVLAQYPEALAAYMRTLEDIVTVESLIEDNGQGPRAAIARLAASTTYATPINAALSFESVAAGLQQLANVEVHGNRTALQGSTLLVPRGLEILAKQIAGTTNREVTTVNGSTSTKQTVPNPASGLKVVVLDPLTWVNLAGSAGSTWFLTAGTNGTIGRPSLVTAFLRGFPAPQTFISSPNALTPAGGLAKWQDGSFLNDSIEFKVRHFVGAKLVLGEAVIVSLGTGVA